MKRVLSFPHHLIMSTPKRTLFSRWGGSSDAAAGSQLAVPARLRGPPGHRASFAVAPCRQRIGFKATAAETAEIAAPGTFPARRSLLGTETAAGREWLPGWRAACPAKWVEQGGRGQRPQTLPLPTPRLYHCQCSWQCNRCPRPPLGCSPGAGCRGRC